MNEHLLETHDLSGSKDTAIPVLTILLLLLLFLVFVFLCVFCFCFCFVKHRPRDLNTGRTKDSNNPAPLSLAKDTKNPRS